MKRWISGCSLMAAALFLSPALATSSKTKEAPTSPLESSEKKPKKVMCSYLYFGQTKFICGDPPLADVKKKCNEKATEDHGKKVECACTDNQSYIQNSCD